MYFWSYRKKQYSNVYFKILIDEATLTLELIEK